MDAKYLKEYIYENQFIVKILEELNMHHIKWHSTHKYLTCAMPDGDNTTSTTIYNNESLNVVAYTRDIKDQYNNSDILSLVCYVKKCYFSHAIKFLCDVVGLDYYFSSEENLPESIRWTKQLLKMQQGVFEEEDVTLKPINEHILSYYLQRPIYQWIVKDGISFDTQIEFEIGFDLRSERATIPIRDDIANLVGIKGRLYMHEPTELRPKYMYLEKCSKTHILYGLHKTIRYIKEKRFVIVCESEKGVMQLWSYGYRNAISISGHTLSKIQIEKITRLGVDVVIAYDKDILEAEVIKECGKFLNCVDVYYLMDKEGLLSENESPMDNKEKFQKLINNNKYFYARG